MTGKQRRAVKRRLSGLYDRWKVDLGLGSWSVKTHLSSDRSGFGRGAAGECLMTCTPDWRYQTAHIEINAEYALELLDDAWLMEYSLVHEFMHAFLHEMAYAHDEPEPARKAHEERVATMLAKAFLWVRDGEARRAKKRAKGKAAG